MQELRNYLERLQSADALLAKWIDQYDIRPTVVDGAVQFTSRGGRAGEIACIVLEAMRDATWPRLKACPDCCWVFFDTAGTARSGGA